MATLLAPRSSRYLRPYLFACKVGLAAIIVLTAALASGQAADFSVTASPASIRVPRLAKGSTIVATTVSSGFRNPINLTASGGPAGSAITLSRNSIASPGIGTAALTISVGGNSPLGTYPVTVTATSGNTIEQTTFNVTVEPGEQMPTGYGWHQLANTVMQSVCLGNVANGMYTNTTMTTTTNYDFDCNQVVPWSGGAVDDSHQRLIVWGGGHSDYAGNEVSVLNLSGTPAWQAITSPTIPVPYVWDGNNWEGLQPYFVRAADGGVYQPGASPSSRHTYNSVQYVPNQNSLYSFGGAVANGGFFSAETWSLNLATATWTLQGPPYSLSPGFPTTAYNPNTGHIIMHDKSWTLYDFNPANGSWTTLTTQYHIDDGTTGAIDPVNNLFVVAGADGTTDNLGYPNVPTSRSIEIFQLVPPYTMTTITDPSCDLVYRDGGLTWDSNLGLVVGYPGGGNQVFLFNTNAQPVVTPFGVVPPQKCLDVPISLNPSPVIGVDYPQNPEGTGADSNLGIFGRFGYFPSLDTFAMVNDKTQNAWTLQLTGGTQAPNFAVSVAPSLTVAEGSQGTLPVSVTVSNGFNNPISLSAAGVPAGTTVTFSPATLSAPGAGTSTMTVNVGASTAAGTYPIVVSATGGGDTQNPIVTLTVTAAGQPSFTLSAQPAALNIQQGNQGGSTITSTISGGFSGAISLSAAGAPSGTTISFTPQTIPAPGSGASAMVITVGANTPAGTYPVTVTGNGGGVQQSTTVTLTVTPLQQPTFTLSASPVSLTVQQGNQGTSAITATIAGGFNSAIALSASGVPTGTAASFSPNPIAAPGSGSSTMTLTVGASTPTGSYPITVTGNGGGIQQTTTVTLVVTASGGGGWQAGFDFRNTATFVTDPSGDNPVLATTAYPYTKNGVTYGWVRTALVQGRDRNAHQDARLAGINFAANGAPATFYVNLPSAGTYNLSLALGDAGYEECWVQCQIQFLDGNTVLATITKGETNENYFYDTEGNNWSAALWPANNLSQQVTLTGARLTVVVGTNQSTGDYTTIGFLGVTQTSGGGSPNYTLSASPSSLTVQQGTQGASTISTTISGGFNSSISLSASGVPSGTTVSFSPNPIAAPGSGNSTMTITVGASTLAGSYPITITGNGGGIQHATAVTLTVTQQQQPSFTISAAPAALTIQQGNQGSSTITTAIGGGFNSSISLSAAGMPSGTTVSFSSNPIPAPGAGNSTMTITVGANTPAGTYPLTVTGNGGGIQHSTAVTLTVTAQQQSYTLTASPASLTIQQGSQGSSIITSTVSGGFNNAISLSVAGTPAGTSISFVPNPIPAPGSGNSTMTITVGSTTATGTYPITVTGNGGGIQQNTTVTLTVTSSGGGGGSGNGIIVYSTSGSSQTNRVVSIGRFFKDGDIPNFAQAVVANTPLLTQCDVKNRWSDGSLKFAIVSFIVPTVTVSGTQVTFQNQGTGNNSGYLEQADMLNQAYNFEGQMQLTGTESPTISARNILQAGDFTYWLQGPIVTAVILEDQNGRSFDVNTDGGIGNPLHPIFEAWFYPQGNQVDLGFTLENSWASSTASNSARNQTFGLTLTTGLNNPTTQLTQSTFTQDIFTRWRRDFWVNSAPPPIQINYNWAYLSSTTAYANFNINYTPNEADLEAMYAVYTSEPAGRLTIPGIDNISGNGGIVNYDENINAAGYSPWIGPYSQWDVDLLMTGDSRMQQMSTQNADLAARFPIFFREADHNAGTGHYFDAPGNGNVDPYGHVVSINARQFATLNLANDWDVSCNNNGPDIIATTLPTDGSQWYTVPGDTSHLPDFAYVPYSLTGRYFYLENEMLEAGFAVGHGMGCYSATASYGREGHYGMLYSTTRELAWALRTMAFAAFVAPDGTPEGPYFASKVANNIAMIEGEHALPQTVTGADPTWAYNWGENYFQFSQAANPSTLSFWRMGDCQDGTTTCYVANGDGANNNINAAVVQSAESGFMSSFIDIVFGLTKQLGIVDTTSILQRDARRYFNILLNPSVNHYLIEQYVYPTTLVGPVCQNPANPGCLWISDWNTFQTGFLSLPTGWSNRGVDYGAEAASALSFMTGLTVDGYSGLNAWNFFTTSDSTYLGQVYNNEPQWSIAPLQ